MSQQWARLPERGNLLALRLIRWIALHIGRSTGRVLLYPITLYFLMTATAARRGSRRFLRRALDREPGWRDLFRRFVMIRNDHIQDRRELLDQVV